MRRRQATRRPVRAVQRPGQIVTTTPGAHRRVAPIVRAEMAANPEPRPAPASTSPWANTSDPVLAEALRTGLVEIVDRREYGDVQARAARAGRLEREAEARHKENAPRRRDGIMAAAADRIFPWERPHYRRMLDVDEASATALIDGLPKGRVPLTELGHCLDPEAAAASGTALPAGASLLTEQERQQLALRRGRA